MALGIREGPHSILQTGTMRPHVAHTHDFCFGSCWLVTEPFPWALRNYLQAHGPSDGELRP